MKITRFYLFLSLLCVFSFYDFVNAENNNGLTDNMIEEAFISFANPAYFPLLEVLIKSVHEFSTRPIIAYGVNADIPFDIKKYPRLIKRRIDGNQLIYYQKFRAILNSNVRYGIYLDADLIVNYKIDDLFQKCRDVNAYPLCPIHPKDPEDQWRIMSRFGIYEKTNPYVHNALIVFSQACLPFIQECYDWYGHYGDLGCPWDELMLNIMVWKHKISNWYLPMCDPFYSFISEYLKEQHMVYNGGKMVEVQYHVFHGCKDPNEALRNFEILKNNVGKPVYASSIKSH